MTGNSDGALTDRGVLALSGEDTRSFLQGLISTDVEKVTPTQAIHGALLTPQGKYLFDFMIAQQGERLLLETEAARLPQLRQKLTMYKLRANVEIIDVSAEITAFALPDSESLEVFDLPVAPGSATTIDGGIVFVDPRLSALGIRALLPSATAAAILADKGLTACGMAAFRALRYRHGVAEGGEELALERATLLENGFHELNGVDFDKGCFVGQELTARMKYRALVKKRLMPIEFKGTPPAIGTPVKAEERDIGEIRSALDGVGLALMRLDRLEDVTKQGTPLQAGDTTITTTKPAWATF